MLKIFKFLIFSTILHIFTFMLVEKSWNCYNYNIRGENLKQRVLKALANPPRIFYVPYSLAILNFLVWFFLFVIFMVVFLIITKGIPMWIPMFFIGMLFIVHTILMFYSKKDMQIAQIIMSKFQVFKRKIPKRLMS